ncbi:MAG TPA: hypothetical protein VFE59_31300 [Trebonia sp.]|jgi:hypothetical protein|nr:hypothetical protein [Trebonia sp.]
MVGQMEAGILFIIGGVPKDQALIRAMIAELTADPLAKAWRSVLTQATDNFSNDDLDVLSQLTDEIAKLCRLRNDWAHGIWFVGFGNEATTDFSQASLKRFRNSAKGAAQSSSVESLPTAEYIGKASSHAARVSDAILSYGLVVSEWRLGELLNHRPSERIRFTKVEGRRQLQITTNGDDWQCSEMP